MKNLSLIIYYFGKFWITIVLFIAMVVSAIVSAPFIVVAKIMDMWREYHLHTKTNHVSGY